MSESSSSQVPAPGLSLSGALLLALIALLPALSLTAFTSFELLRKGVASALGCLALIAWSVGLMRQRRVELAAPRVTIWLVCLAVWATIAIAWSPVPLLGALDASYMVALAGAALLALAPTDASPGRARLAGAAGLGTALAGALGMADAAGVGMLNVVWNPPGATGGWDAAEFGLVYYAIALPVLAAAQSLPLAKPARVLSGAGLLLGALHGGMMAAELSVLSAACLIAPLGLVGVLAHLKLSNAAPARWASALAIGLVVLGFPLAGVAPGSAGEPRVSDATDIAIFDMSARPIRIDSKLDKQLRNVTFITGRIESPPLGDARGYLWSVAGSLVAENPLVGQGAGGWWLRQTRAPHTEHPYAQRMFLEYPAMRSPHSAPLLIAVQYGLLGLALALIWVALTTAVGLAPLRGARLEPEQDAGWLMALGGWTGGLLVAPFFGLMDVAPATLLWVVSGGLLLRELVPTSPRFGWRAPWRGAEQRVFWPALTALVLGASMMAPPSLNLVSDYWRGVADHLMLRAYYDKAQEAYIKAFDMYPGHGDLAYNAALAAHRVGKLQNSRELLNLALTLRPDDARVLTLGATAHIRKRDVGPGIELSRQAIAAWPLHIEAHKGLAISYNLGNDMERAASALQDVIKLAPPAEIEAALRFQLAELYEGPLSKPALAIEQYELALKQLGQGTMRDRAAERLAELKRRIQRERLEREGKPIPPELRIPEDDGHGHGHPH
jgi:tetratricopeptide (TPR) repeat protein